MNSFRFIRLVTILVSSLAVTFPLFAANSNSDNTKPTTTRESRSTKATKIDLNTADVATLETLPGVGPQTARAIVAARPFNSVNDLEKVSGIGPAKLSELKSLVTVSKTPTQKEMTAGTTPKNRADANAAAVKPSSVAKESAASTARKVDVNTADVATLETLPGVGAQTARAIVAARPFASVDDLERVPGIGPVKLADLRDRVTVSHRSAAAKKDAAAEKRSTASTRSTPANASESTVSPAAPYEPATAPRTTRNANPDRPLEPTGRLDTTRSGDTRGATSTAQKSASSVQGRVNLNTATLQELEALPEIGPVKAQAIIDARPFTSIEDVMRVKGIKEGTFEVIKDKISVR
jgi:competence protein ComEA